nr:hypothetical protein [Tanacetum cinerariifolium]
MIQCSDIPSVKKIEQINKIEFINAGGIDSESEEIEDFLNDDLIQFGIEDSPFNMDKDILFLEKSSTKNLIPIPNECIVVSENGNYINRMEMLFTINPRPHNPTNDNTNIESFSSFPNQENKPRQEEIDVFSITNDVLPPSNDDSNEEVDVVDNVIQNSEHEYSKIVGNLIVKFECIDARMKFDVFNAENDVFKFIMFSLLSAENEDTIFDPDEEPSSGIMWLKGRVKKDGEFTDDDIRSVGDKLIKEGTWNLDDGTDAMTFVFGKEKEGYARGVGSEVTYKSYFQQYTQLAILEFCDTLIQHLKSVKKSINERAQHKREYDNWVNERHMQKIEEKIDTSKALDASMVDTESSGTESKEQDTSSRSGNDAHDDADIRPIYDEEPMAKGFKEFSTDEQGMTSDHNSSELKIHDYSNEQSSSKLVLKVVPSADKTDTLRQEL